MLAAQSRTKAPHQLPSRLGTVRAGNIPALPGAPGVQLYGLTSEFSPGTSRVTGTRNTGLRQTWFNLTVA